MKILRTNFETAVLYLKTALFLILTLAVIVLGYLIIPNSKVVLWAALNPEKVERVKNAYEKAYREIDRGAVVIIK